MLMAIDPGAIAGVAIFDGDTLDSVRRVKHARSWVCDTAVDKLVVETPVITRSTRNPASIITLAITAGILIGKVDAKKLERVAPSTWKGSRPKDVDNRYTLRLLSELERYRMGVLISDHNVIDAVGIGLWALGRR
jgi:hypothetical protein